MNQRKDCDWMWVVICLAILLLPTQAVASQPEPNPVLASEPGAEPAPKLDGFIDPNMYWDSRGFAVATVNMLVRFPHRIQYFGFVNYWAPPQASQPTELSEFYSEQNLRWAPVKRVPLDINAQWVLRSGDGNDLLRPGLRWRISNTPGMQWLLTKLHTFYSVTWHPYQLDFDGEQGWQFQVEHVYRVNLLKHTWDRRLYIGGFMDHNLWVANEDAPWASRIVTEHQLGVRVLDELHVVGEYRYNQFLAGSEHGVGVGLEYTVPFALKR